MKRREKIKILLTNSVMGENFEMLLSHLKSSNKRNTHRNTFIGNDLLITDENCSFFDAVYTLSISIISQNS